MSEDGWYGSVNIFSPLPFMRRIGIHPSKGQMWLGWVGSGRRCIVSGGMDVRWLGGVGSGRRWIVSGGVDVGNGPHKVLMYDNAKCSLKWSSSR